MRALSCFALVSFFAPAVWAQAEPPATDKPAADPKDGPAADSEADAEAGSEEPETSTAEATPAVKPAAEPTEAPPAPLLAAPTADDQSPGPYVAPPEPEGPERKLDIGPDFGITARPAKGDDISYSPGFTWGAHLRVELTHFLGFRAYFNNSYHAVDVPSGALAAHSSSPDDVDQDDLKVTMLGARLEPTWVVTPELRLWLGAGVAWGRVFAEEPVTEPDTASSDRTGVLLEWTGSIGGSYDVIPNWLAITLLLNGGFVSNQSGDVFDRTQAIGQNGQLTYLGGLPEFASTMSALVGLGLIL